MTRFVWLVLAAVVVLPGLARPAAAQAQPKRKVIRLDEFTVEGKIQKPQAFYILPRSSLNYEGLDRDESFLPKVQKSLEHEPF